MSSPAAAAILRLGRVASSSRIPPTSTLRSAVLRRNFQPSQSALEFTKFNMPAMSPTMTEGGIAQWKKKEGEAFSAGDVLLEIETDKATMDVEAQDDGVLAKIIIGDGSKNIQVNSVIAIIAEEGDDLFPAEALAAEAIKEFSKPAGGAGALGKPKKEEARRPEPSKKEEPKQEEPKQEASTSSSGSSSSLQLAQSKNRDKIFASPLAKKLAIERGVPLLQVNGTGPNGRIVKADIDSYKAAPAASSSSSSSSSSPASPVSGISYTDIPVSNMRKVIAQRLTESKFTVPHYYVSIDIEMDKILRLRQLFNDASAKRFKADEKKAKEAKLSVGDFITKAVAVALDEVPELRAAWMGDKIRQYDSSDISIAVSTPTGLITPIIKDVGHRGLSDISSETKQLARLARDGHLKTEQYQGGNFTISNMGMFGPTWFSAIINPPQAAILATGTTRSIIIPDAESEKGFRVAQVMSATASFDHRVVDGATGAKWIDALKRALENPLSFML